MKRRGLPRPAELAHQWVRRVVKPGETAIDATAGNGHDSVFLARLVGPGGRLLAFDVQAAAIGSTRAALREWGLDDGRAELFHESHEELARRAGDAPVAAVMFNLGYLPGGDHRLITRPEATLAAIKLALGVLRPGGILTVVAYPGHPGGDAETAAVFEWAAHLDPTAWRVTAVRVHNTARPAPVLLATQKI
jgi:predicted methyltransferase